MLRSDDRASDSVARSGSDFAAPAVAPLARLAVPWVFFYCWFCFCSEGPRLFWGLRRRRRRHGICRLRVATRALNQHGSARANSRFRGDTEHGGFETTFGEAGISR